MPNLSSAFGYSGSAAYYIAVPPGSLHGVYVKLAATVKKGTCCCSDSCKKKSYEKWKGDFTVGAYVGSPSWKFKPSVLLIENLKECPKDEAIHRKGIIKITGRVSLLLGTCEYTLDSGWSCSGGIRLDIQDISSIRVTIGGGMKCERTTVE